MSLDERIRQLFEKRMGGLDQSIEDDIIALKNAMCAFALDAIHDSQVRLELDKVASERRLSLKS